MTDIENADCVDKHALAASLQGRGMAQNCVVDQAIWAKGYTELLDLMDKHKQRNENHMYIDCYGSGEDLEEVTQSTPAFKVV